MPSDFTLPMLIGPLFVKGVISHSFSNLLKKQKREGGGLPIWGWFMID
jgi:hypothetical protein